MSRLKIKTKSKCSPTNKYSSNGLKKIIQTSLSIAALGVCTSLSLSVSWVSVFLQPIAGAVLITTLRHLQSRRSHLLVWTVFWGSFLAGALYWIAFGIYRPPVNSWGSTAWLMGSLWLWQLLLYQIPFTFIWLALHRKRTRASLGQVTCAIALACMAAEVWRSFHTLPLAWGQWGHGAIDNPLLNGLYPITGSVGVAGAQWLLSGLLVHWWQTTRSQKASHRMGIRMEVRMPWRLTVATTALALLIHDMDWTQPTGQESMVRIVHTHWPNAEKYLPHNQKQAISTLLGEAQTSTADLTIFPELFLVERISSLPAHLRRQLTDSVQKQGGALLFGVVGVVHPNHLEPALTGKQNTLVLLTPNDEAQLYNKRRLLPFSEYLPHQPWLQWVWPYLYRYPLADLIPGTMQQVPLKLGGIAIGPLICSELTSPLLSAQQSLLSQIIVSPSNDAWIDSPMYAWQAHNLARVRAAEIQKPVLRANNLGISAFIDHHGKSLAHFSGDFGSGQWPIQPRSGSTPYAALVDKLHTAWNSFAP